MAAVRKFLQPLPGSFLLFSPRGTGKSTWLAPDVLRACQARPERLSQLIAAAGTTANMVVIDQIQTAPQLLDVVHALVAVLIGPFLTAELGQDFDLMRAQSNGLLPLVWQTVDPQATLPAYDHCVCRKKCRQKPWCVRSAISQNF
ncbi:MAG: hypothetical protein RLZZ274_1496 [Cyanobacteriota bacterium]